jgi:hypothetical protein
MRVKHKKTIKTHQQPTLKMYSKPGIRQNLCRIIQSSFKQPVGAKYTLKWSSVASNYIFRFLSSKKTEQSLFPDDLDQNPFFSAVKLPVENSFPGAEIQFSDSFIPLSFPVLSYMSRSGNASAFCRYSRHLLFRYNKLSLSFPGLYDSCGIVEFLDILAM